MSGYADSLRVECAKCHDYWHSRVDRDVVRHGAGRSGVTPDAGKVLVTGAAGGVGSVAVLLLARLGYHVVAVTGRPETHAFLSALGAKEFISRETMNQPCCPLEAQRWAGAVDVVGGGNVGAGAGRNGLRWSGGGLRFGGQFQAGYYGDAVYFA